MHFRVESNHNHTSKLTFKQDPLSSLFLYIYFFFQDLNNNIVIKIPKLITMFYLYTTTNFQVFFCIFL